MIRRDTRVFVERMGKTGMPFSNQIQSYHIKTGLFFFFLFVFFFSFSFWSFFWGGLVRGQGGPFLTVCKIIMCMDGIMME